MRQDSVARNPLILSELLRVDAPLKEESPFSNGLVLRGLGAT